MDDVILIKEGVREENILNGSKSLNLMKQNVYQKGINLGRNLSYCPFL